MREKIVVKIMKDKTNKDVHPCGFAGRKGKSDVYVPLKEIRKAGSSTVLTGQILEAEIVETNKGSVATDIRTLGMKN